MLKSLCPPLPAAVLDFDTNVKNEIVGNLLEHEQGKRCKFCGKLFRDQECGVKHLNRRHMDMLRPKAKAFRESAMYDFMSSDPIALWSSVVFEPENAANRTLPQMPTMADYQDFDDPRVRNGSGVGRSLVDYSNI